MNSSHSICRFHRFILLKRCFFKQNNVKVRYAVNLAYKVYGNNPSEGVPIIALHGLLGSKKNWESLSKNISKATSKSVVAVDLRNHGESQHDSSHTYPELASDVSLLMDKLSIKQAILLGHSMGGRTSMVLALTEPAKVHMLIPIDISPVSTAAVLNDFFPKLIDILRTINLQGMDNIGEARKVAKKKLKEAHLVADVDSLYFVLMNIGTRHDNTVGWMCNLDALKKHFNDISTFPKEMAGKKYEGRTLFIGGDQSSFIPTTDITGIRVFFPKAELKYIKGVGHNVHAENPGAFITMVTDFINK